MDRRMSTFDKKPPLVEPSVHEQDTETLLLERLKNSQSESDYFRWLLFVVGFYRGIQKVDAATALLRRFIETSNSDDQKAHCHLTLGQIATDEQNFEAALKYFKTALGLNPQQKKIVYVLHNNTAYCLNMLHCYEEAEQHCRLAIEVSWMRASAYRNLGVSLKGQVKIVESMWALVEAAKLDVSDERARQLHRQVIEENPDVIVQCPWVVDGLAPSTSSENTLQN